MTWKDYLKSVLWGILIMILVWGVLVIGIGKLIEQFSPYFVGSSSFDLFAISLWILSLLFGFLVCAWRASIYSKK
jgi:hypothetical protein